MVDIKKLTAKQYFISIGLMTLLGLSVLVAQDAELKQLIKETLGLSKPLQAAEDSFYQQRVEHIFEKYCVACHNNNKAKGHLRLDAYRYTRFGGRSGDILAAGENSILMQRMRLPEEDRLAMPPYGRDRQTSDELKVIDLWLQKGASGVLNAEHFAEAPAKVKEIHFAELDLHAIDQARLPLALQVKALQRKYPLTLHYVTRTSAELELTGMTLKTNMTDQVFNDFKTVASQIVALDLTATSISDKAIEDMATMRQLKSINLKSTMVTQTGVAALAQLPHLQRLVVNAAAVDKELSALFKAQDINLVVVEVPL